MYQTLYFKLLGFEGKIAETDFKSANITVKYSFAFDAILKLSLVTGNVHSLILKLMPSRLRIVYSLLYLGLVYHTLHRFLQFET